MQAQALPAAASNYAAAQRLEQQAAIAAVLRQWRLMNDDFDSSWLRIAPTIKAILVHAQTQIIDQSQVYVPAVLDETGQASDPMAESLSGGLRGLTGAGLPIEYALGLAPVRAKQAVESGSTAWQALETAGKWLSLASGTLLSDTGRAAENLSMYAHANVGGYVRMLVPPSCGRCIVQAGKWFRYNQGFERHPGCDCRHIPVSEAVAGDLTIDPQAYFDSLDESGQAKMVGGAANAQAVRDGADIGQIINAYGRTSGMQFAQVSPIKVNAHGDKFTLAGTTRRADAFKQQLALRRNGTPQARLMPETIARIAKDDADRMRLLKLYGWIRDEAAITRARTIIADQRRSEKAVRDKARRAARQHTR